MNAKTETQSSSMDTVKLSVSAVLLVAAIAAFYLLGAQPVWMRLLALLGILGVAIFVFVQATVGQKLKHFFQAAVIEVRRVVWPSRQETMQTTLVIIGAVFVMSLFMWGVDSILFMLVRWVTG